MRPFITLWEDAVTTMCLPSREQVLYQLIKRGYIQPDKSGYWRCISCKPSKKVVINQHTHSIRKWIYYYLTGDLPEVLPRYKHNYILDYRKATDENSI